ncbi:MAG: hypothetical protein AB2A00_38415 [Myxococcota bacterium]
MTSAISLAFDRSPLARDRFMSRLLRPLPVTRRAELREDVLVAARQNWEARTRSEYRGVMIVRHFHGLLVDLNAPTDVQELALLMMLQEQQHAALCMQAAVELGADGTLSFHLDELQLARHGRPDEELLRMLCGTYATGEVVALALIRHAIRVLPPSPFRDILRGIARDEVLHARIGPALLQQAREDDEGWLPYPGDDVIRRMVRESMEHMLTRDVVEAEEEALFQDVEAAAQLRSVGIPPSTAFKKAYERAVREDVARGLARVGIVL